MDARVIGDALCVTFGKEVDGQSVRDVLTTELGLPAGFAGQLFAESRVLSGGHVLSSDDLLRAGMRIWLQGGIEGENNALQATDGLSTPLDSLQVLYEDDHLLIVDKPAGILMYPGTSSDTDTLAHRVAAYFASQGQRHKVHHVHRLDRDTSGTVLYAKHDYSARTLDGMLAARKIGRSYVALVQGALTPSNGRIDAAIGRDRHVSGRYRVSKTGKPAVTYYETLAVKRVGNTVATLVKCQLETGRTHQIRVHLASHGCPIVGDTLYGAGVGIGSVEWTEGIALHAFSLCCKHPYGRSLLDVQAPFPKAYVQATDALSIRTALPQVEVIS